MSDAAARRAADRIADAENRRVSHDHGGGEVAPENWRPWLAAIIAAEYAPALEALRDADAALSAVLRNERAFCGAMRKAGAPGAETVFNGLRPKRDRIRAALRAMGEE